MGLITPDAFFQAYRNKKATFECLKAFRRFNPNSFVYLVSDGGDDLSDIARFFGCEYDRLDRLGRAPWDTAKKSEWLRRLTHAARHAKSNYMQLLEDDVLIRGPVDRAEDFTMAGPHHAHARLSRGLFDNLRRRNPRITSDHYGGCGGTMVHRETLLDCAANVDYNDSALSGALDHRLVHNDVFLTVLFLVRGHIYQSLEDNYCEATSLYPGWESNGRAIVHQYKRFYGQQLTREDRDLLAGCACPAPAGCASTTDGNGQQAIVKPSFVVVLGQGRSGSTLIMRLLNAVPGVRISGENNRAFDGLCTFAECFSSTVQDDDGSFYSTAWTAPPGISELPRHMRDFILSVYDPQHEFLIVGFKEIRYGQDYERLERDVEFLRSIFPELKVILNVRDTESCLQSGWWPEKPAESREVLESMRASFGRYYREHRDFCYWMPYIELRKGSDALRGMFEFVGIAFRTEYENELSHVLR